MTLDLGICSRARLARDARFDGKFYIGVLTTKIYCRPICRSRTSQEKNVRYFPTAAAAAQAGFRPCLRCRPECSPGTAAWAGTKNTVSRALRLINESGLEEGGIEALAERLGLGSRHLRRLFLRHLGAAPRAVAQTRRLHFAKKLIDETSLRMIQIAVAAGFGSVRRFNAAIFKVYRRTPTEMRERAAKKIAARSDNEYFLRLDYRPPYDWQSMLEAMRAHATPGVEMVEDVLYRRSICVSGAVGHFEASVDPARHSLNLRVEIGEPRSLFFITERVRGMFDLNADWPTIERTLSADPLLAAPVSAHPGVRVAGCWSGFELAVQTLLGGQSNPARATLLAGRLVREFGAPLACPLGGLTHLYPAPQILAHAALERVGISRSRSIAVRTLSRAVNEGRISFEKVADPGALLAQLASLPGFSPSAVEYVAMRALREPDAFPFAEREAGAVPALGDALELEHRSEAWRPWRAYAAAYLGAYSAELRGGS
jgi:AraC family transcriptional regulator of adaptative response / DNA-3-methyladenine glycosylase II